MSYTLLPVLDNATSRQLEQAAACNHTELFCRNAIVRCGEVRVVQGLTYTYEGVGFQSMIAFPSLKETTADEQLDEMMRWYAVRPNRGLGCWSLDLPQPLDLGFRLKARGFQEGWRPCWMGLDLWQQENESPERVEVMADGMRRKTDDAKMMTGKEKMKTGDVEKIKGEVQMRTDDLEKMKDDTKMRTDDVKKMKGNVQMRPDDTKMITGNEKMKGDVKIMTGDGLIIGNNVQIIADNEMSLADIKDLPYTGHHGAISPELLRRQPEQAQQFIAWRKGKVVGHCSVFFTTGNYGVAGIYDVAVVPAARGKGIGKALVSAACRHGREKGYRYAVLNATGRHMYEQIGFQWVGDGFTWWLLPANSP